MLHVHVPGTSRVAAALLEAAVDDQASALLLASQQATSRAWMEALPIVSVGLMWTQAWTQTLLVSAGRMLVCCSQAKSIRNGQERHIGEGERQAQKFVENVGEDS